MRFSILKNRSKHLRLIRSTPSIEDSIFIKCNWHDFYWGAKESIPADAPEPRKNVVPSLCFVNANHAGTCVTGRSQTGILLFVNRGQWYGIVSIRILWRLLRLAANLWLWGLRLNKLTLCVTYCSCLERRFKVLRMYSARTKRWLRMRYSLNLRWRKTTMWLLITEREKPWRQEC